MSVQFETLLIISFRNFCQPSWPQFIYQLRSFGFRLLVKFSMPMLLIKDKYGRNHLFILAMSEQCHADIILLLYFKFVLMCNLIYESCHIYRYSSFVALSMVVNFQQHASMKCNLDSLNLR